MTACQTTQACASLNDPRGRCDDDRLVRALASRNEAAFVLLIERYQRQLTHLALHYVPNLAIAEDVVQETWIGVLQGIHRFRGETSLQTWITRILINRAITHAAREQRYIALSSYGMENVERSALPYVTQHAEANMNDVQVAYITSAKLPDEHVLANELGAYVRAAVATLPQLQRAVITLRDIAGLRSDEVRASLGISATHERVLLHRARMRVRQHLAAALRDT